MSLHLHVGSYLLVGSFSFFVTFGFVCFLINFILLSFLETRDREDVDQDGRGDGNELGGIGGEKTVIRIHCMEKVYFQLKKNPKTFKIPSQTLPAHLQNTSTPEVHVNTAKVHPSLLDVLEFSLKNSGPKLLQERGAIPHQLPSPLSQAVPPPFPDPWESLGLPQAFSGLRELQGTH